MPSSVAFTVVLDSIGSLGALWGTSYAIVNWLGRNKLDLTTTTHMANCARISGDSEGWQESLKQLEIHRRSNGWFIGDLHFGYPGRHVLPILLESQVGTRYLGILCMISFLHGEDSAGEQVYAFMNDIADGQTSMYTLSYEQCKRIWTLSREVYLDSPMRHTYLRICDTCISRFPDLGEMYTDSRPNKRCSLSQVMSAALRVWELGKKTLATRRNAQLWVKGSSGFGFMIFYLTSVCGFYVEVLADGGNLTFGEIQSMVSVQMSFGTIGSEEWETGLLLNQSSIREAVTDVFTFNKRNGGEWSPDRNQRPSPVMDTRFMTVSLPNDYERHSIINLSAFNIFMDDIERAKVLSYVQHWVVNALHWMVYKVFVSTIEPTNNNERAPQPHRNDTHREALISGLHGSLETFAPGLLEPCHFQRLRRCILGREPPEKYQLLLASIPDDRIRDICPNHSDTSDHMNDYENEQYCKFPRLDGSAATIINRIWICAHLERTGQILLRDSCCRDSDIRMGRTGSFTLADIIKRPSPTYYPPSGILNSIARALTDGWRNEMEFETRTIAIAAGGAVIGFHGNDKAFPEDDRGFTAYILPGIIETSDRNITQVVESSDSSTRGDYSLAGVVPSFLATLTEPSNAFGAWEVSITSATHRDSTAEIRMHVGLGEMFIPIRPLRAISQSLFVDMTRSCMRNCVSGLLEVADVAQTRILTPKTFQLIDELVYTGTDGWSLLVVPIRDHVPLQRALLSMISTSAVSVRLSRINCVHCAVKQALVSRQPMLLL